MDVLPAWLGANRLLKLLNQPWEGDVTMVLPVTTFSAGELRRCGGAAWAGVGGGGGSPKWVWECVLGGGGASANTLAAAKRGSRPPPSSPPCPRVTPPPFTPRSQGRHQSVKGRSDPGAQRGPARRMGKAARHAREFVRACVRACAPPTPHTRAQARCPSPACPRARRPPTTTRTHARTHARTHHVAPPCLASHAPLLPSSCRPCALWRSRWMSACARCVPACTHVLMRAGTACRCMRARGRGEGARAPAARRVAARPPPTGARTRTRPFTCTPHPHTRAWQITSMARAQRQRQARRSSSKALAIPGGCGWLAGLPTGWGRCRGERCRGARRRGGGALTRPPAHAHTPRRRAGWRRHHASIHPLLDPRPRAGDASRGVERWPHPQRLTELRVT